jgi:tetratricopeptide (TPR) repeat protein
LAQHFDAAGDETRALRYFTLAGNAAARVYANAEAAHHYSRALVLARRVAHVDGQTLRHLFFSLGHALELSAQDARALDTYEDTERVARERGDHAMELAAMIARATIYLKPVSVRDPDKGRSLSEHTLALARERGDRDSETKSLWNLMQFYKWTGQMEEALAQGEQALAIARELGQREHLAYVLHDIASIYAATGQMQRGLAVMDEVQQLWRELGVLNMLADCLATTAEFHVLRGEYERAFALSGEALRISRTIGNLWNESYSWYLIDLAYMDRGEMGRAIEAAEESLRLAKQGWPRAITRGHSPSPMRRYRFCARPASAWDFPMGCISKAGRSSAWAAPRKPTRR